MIFVHYILFIVNKLLNKIAKQFFPSRLILRMKRKTNQNQRKKRSKMTRKKLMRRRRKRRALPNQL
jgi:hypothetical protein